MFRISSKTMIIIGGVLLTLSVIIPALRLAEILPALIWIDFLTYALLVSGLFLGMMGIFTYAKEVRDRNRE
ncbi:MAG TPA: hypothetical protein PK459_08235 [Anaerolineaceae bacterium]|nr:hypothetical protein [Anaerolineaceae bacterium]HQC65070.1 hypothetical protein [Anaerolineaceae bacterium]HQN68777.1 hypothetical protein [Anaerolineaceae bacterium]